MKINQILADGMRRQEINHSPNYQRLVILQYPSSVKTAISDRLIVPLNFEVSRCLCWYNFTQKGLKAANAYRKSLNMVFGDPDNISVLWNLS